MPIFNKYAKYYDILYAEKDYTAECDYLESIIKKYATQPVQSILDLGCGTGGHAFELSRRGYQVDGVDYSREMIEIANSRINSDLYGKVNFIQKNILDLDLQKQYDAAISMFAVMSYMATNDDLARAFQTAHRHLKSGSIFFFDAWSGPAVLTQRPEQRVKEIRQGDSQIIRMATPTLDITKNIVDVKYHIVEMENNQVVKDITEIHRMRYLFPVELEYILYNNGFKPLRIEPFMKNGQVLTESDWELSVVAMVQ